VQLSKANMQLTLTLFALQQYCINDNTLDVGWETLQTFAIQSKARKARKELLARNGAYMLRIATVKQQAML